MNKQFLDGLDSSFSIALLSMSSRLTESHEFTNFINEIGVLMRFGQPGRHRQQCYAERAIQAIQELLIHRMTAQELKTGEPSLEWVDDFYIIVDAVDRKWRRDPPKMPVSLPRISKNDALLSEGIRVRVKLDEPISVLGKNCME